jgi:hypothetical protein
MVEVTRRTLIGGGCTVAFGSILTAVALRDDIALAIQHQFDSPITVDVEVTVPDTGEYKHQGTVEVPPSATERIEFVDTDVPALNVQLLPDQGTGGSYTWAVDSKLTGTIDDTGVDWTTN